MKVLLVRQSSLLVRQSRMLQSPHHPKAKGAGSNPVGRGKRSSSEKWLE
jgi:hypothetical protein